MTFCLSFWNCYCRWNTENLFFFICQDETVKNKEKSNKTLFLIWFPPCRRQHGKIRSFFFTCFTLVGVEMSKNQFLLRKNPKMICKIIVSFCKPDFLFSPCDHSVTFWVTIRVSAFGLEWIYDFSLQFEIKIVKNVSSLHLENIKICFIW